MDVDVDVDVDGAGGVAASSDARSTHVCDSTTQVSPAQQSPSLSQSAEVTANSTPVMASAMPPKTIPPMAAASPVDPPKNPVPPGVVAL